MRLTIKPNDRSPDVIIEHVARLLDITGGEEENIIDIDLGEDMENPKYQRTVYVNPDNVAYLIVDAED